MNNPFPAFKGEPSTGVLGHPDPVAWGAMQSVIATHAQHRNTSIALHEARRMGRVGTSLALAEELCGDERRALQAQEVCVRLAGEPALVTAIAVTQGKAVAK